MRFEITARHTGLPDSVKEYAQEKICKLERFFEDIINVNLVLDVEFHARRDKAAPSVSVEDLPATAKSDKTDEVSGEVSSAELIVKIARENTPFVAHARGENYKAAIDVVVDKMERQLRKCKEKLEDRNRQPR